MDTTFQLLPKLQRTAGIDVHTKKRNVCVMDNDGGYEFKVFGTNTTILFLFGIGYYFKVHADTC
jgi:hypothetical protein